MLNFRSIFGIFLVILISSILSFCSAGTEIDTALVSIDTGLGRVNRNISRSAAPMNILSIQLSVTGEYMNDMFHEIPLDTGAIVLEVDAGKSRRFDIMAYISPGDPGIVKSCRGSAIMDLKPGREVDLAIEMRIYETKIVIPDYGNSRIVQIDGFAGSDEDIDSSWVSLNNEDLGYDTFAPRDIDFDHLGRIYIAADHNGVESIIRIDNIYDTGPYESFPDPGTTDIWTLSIDREGGFVYYADNSRVYRCGLDGSGNAVFLSSAVNEEIDFGDAICGIAVDSAAGRFYVACQDYVISQNEIIFYVYDIDTLALLSSFSEYSGSSGDVTVAPSGIYGAVYDPDGDNTIIQFEYDSDSGVLSSTGFYVSSIYGFVKFLPPVNRGICFFDETAQGEYEDRVVYMDDIDGVGRRDYGETGTGVGQFRFFLPL